MTVCSVLLKFQSSKGAFDCVQQMYVPCCSLQPRCHPAVSSHLFLFSAVQHSHKDACCQQQQRYFKTAHSQQHFQAPIQEFV